MTTRKTTPTTNPVNRTLNEITERLHAMGELLDDEIKATDQLAKQMRLARGTVDVTKQARIATRPATEYYVGDDGPTPELYEVVERMLSEKPMTLQALIDETGARKNRLNGVIVRLQKDGYRVVNLGDANRALWFIASDAVAARLAATLRLKRK